MQHVCSLNDVRGILCNCPGGIAASRAAARIAAAAGARQPAVLCGLWVRGASAYCHDSQASTVCGELLPFNGLLGYPRWSASLMYQLLFSLPSTSWPMARIVRSCRNMHECCICNAQQDGWTTVAKKGKASGGAPAASSSSPSPWSPVAASANGISGSGAPAAFNLPTSSAQQVNYAAHRPAQSS